MVVEGHGCDVEAVGKYRIPRKLDYQVLRALVRQWCACRKYVSICKIRSQYAANDNGETPVCNCCWELYQMSSRSTAPLCAPYNRYMPS